MDFFLSQWDAYEAKHLGVSPGKKARLALNADVSSNLNEVAQAVLANMPSKCDRCDAATAWMNDMYRPGVLFVYCTRFRSHGASCNWSTHRSATDPTPRDSSSSNPSATSSARPHPVAVVEAPEKPARKIEQTSLSSHSFNLLASLCGSYNKLELLIPGWLENRLVWSLSKAPLDQADTFIID